MKNIIVHTNSDPPIKTADLARYTGRFLRALVDVAARNTRRQAEVVAVLREFGMLTDEETVLFALGSLVKAGSIRNVVPLYDGGTMVTVVALSQDL